MIEWVNFESFSFFDSNTSMFTYLIMGGGRGTKFQSEKTVTYLILRKYYSITPDHACCRINLPWSRSGHRDDHDVWVIFTHLKLWIAVARHKFTDGRVAYTQSTQYIEPILVSRWPTVYDAGPTINQHWLNVNAPRPPLSRTYSQRLVVWNNSW